MATLFSIFLLAGWPPQPTYESVPMAAVFSVALAWGGTLRAGQLAMADRDEYYGDPLFVDVPLAALFSDAYTAIRRPLIDMRRASHEARPGDPLATKPLRRGCSRL